MNEATMPSLAFAGGAIFSLLSSWVWRRSGLGALVACTLVVSATLAGTIAVTGWERAPAAVLVVTLPAALVAGIAPVAVHRNVGSIIARMAFGGTLALVAFYFAVFAALLLGWTRETF